MHGTPATMSTSVRIALPDALRQRVVVADGAMGTMLQAADLDAGRLRGPRGLQRDPQRHPAGRRPRRARRLLRRRACDGVETNTFGANLANLAEYGIADRIRELAEAGARHRPRGRRRAASTPRPATLGARLDRPGHQAAHARPRAVTRRCATPTRRRPRACSPAAPTRCSSRPARTCCRPRRRSSAPGGRWPPPACDVPLIVQVTVETTGTMLLGSEIGAALTALEPLGIDLHRPELRHRPRRDERAPALPVPARRGSRCRCMPNAGLPVARPERRASTR